MIVPTRMLLASRALRSAQTLLDDGDPNGACNRAYYAVFEAINAALETTNAPATKTHRGIRSLFVQYFPDLARKGETASKTIHDTQLAREVADYRGEFVPAEEAQQAVQRAQSFVSAIAQEFFPEG